MAANVCYRTLQSSRFAPTLHIAAMLILLCRTCGVSGDAQLVRAGRQLLKRDPRRRCLAPTGATIYHRSRRDYTRERRELSSARESAQPASFACARSS
jgi:hypothetical protein